MSLTRRELFAATAVFGVGACGITAGVLPPIALPARAQDSVSPADLARGAPPEGDVVIGSDKAPVTIIEYASLTSPMCALFARQTLPELKTRYIDPGKVRYMVREFPIDPVAEGGFMVARCASPDKYEAIIETLLAKQVDWAVNRPLAPLQAIAEQFGFTKDSFAQCLANQKVLTNVQMVRDFAASELRVDSAPTFFINGKRFLGPLLIEDLAQAIDSSLKGG